MKKMLLSINLREAYYAFFTLLPIGLFSLISHDLEQMKIGLISISLYITYRKLNMSYNAIFAHYVAILLLLAVFLFFSKIIILFSITAGIAAFITIYVSQYGSNLRILGNFIFIPSLYLSCELSEKSNYHLIDIVHFFMISSLSLIAMYITKFIFEKK